MRSIGFTIRVDLRIPRATSEDEARRLLARAKDGCLISHSLKADCAEGSESSLLPAREGGAGVPVGAARFPPRPGNFPRILRAREFLRFICPRESRD
jgi:hypothetical protein